MTREGVDAAGRGDQRDRASLKDSDFPKQARPPQAAATLEVQSRAYNHPQFALPPLAI
jgi:hypothetical protein